MKTIFTLLLASLVSVSVMAAGTRPKSTLIIRSAERGDIRVVIDGRRFEPNDNFLRIRNLESGYHNVKIYRERTSGAFNIFGKRYEVIFNRSMRIMNNTMIMIDRYGRATVNERRSNGRYDRNDREYGYGYGNRDNRDYDPNDRDWNDRNSNDRDWDDRNWDRNHDFEYDRNSNNGDYGDRDRDVRWNDRDSRDYNGFNRAMSDIEFSRVLQSMQREWLENNKAKSASQVISANYFTTAQVKQMLQLFSFENLKLDLAKQAYTKTVDQRNYYMINDVFSSGSSQTELERYIRNIR